MATIQNGADWTDTTGRLILAHEGSIARFGDPYYWYGVDELWDCSTGLLAEDPPGEAVDDFVDYDADGEDGQPQQQVVGNNPPGFAEGLPAPQGDVRCRQ